MFPSPTRVLLAKPPNNSELHLPGRLKLEQEAKGFVSDLYFLRVNQPSKTQKIRHSHRQLDRNAPVSPAGRCRLHSGPALRVWNERRDGFEVYNLELTTFSLHRYTRFYHTDNPVDNEVLFCLFRSQRSPDRFGRSISQGDRVRARETNNLNQASPELVKRASASDVATVGYATLNGGFVALFLSSVDSSLTDFGRSQNDWRLWRNYSDRQHA